MHRLFSDTKCVCILPARTYIAIWCATTPDNKSHVPYDCIPHNKRHDASFYNGEFGYLHFVAVSFQLIVYINTKTTKS